jgi:hypothetical protein
MRAIELDALTLGDQTDELRLPASAGLLEYALQVGARRGEADP